MAQRAWDEMVIIRTISQVAHAQDDLDYDAYVGCFTDTVLLTAAVVIPGWQGGEISVHDLAIQYFDHLARFDAVHHMVFNHLIDVDGDEASCVADLYAMSVLIQNGEAQSYAIGGRYFLRLRRDGERWRICERSITQRYQIGDKALLAAAAAREPVRAVKMAGTASDT
jgi:hypothetical protein